MTTYKQRIRTLSLAPYADGRFEVSVDDAIIHSKLETGVFPEHDAVGSALDRQTAG